MFGRRCLYPGRRSEPPLTDLYIMGGRKVENLVPPNGFEQLPIDLNIQNWGNWAAYYLYLCYKKLDRNGNTDSQE